MNHLPDGTNIGKYYVQIVPSAQGISGSISGLLDGEAAEAGASSGASIAGNLIGTLKSAVAAAGIGKFIGESLRAGADLQQSVGGIETLFGTNGKSIEEFAASAGKSVAEVRGEYEMLERAQETALGNARNAYQTAGLSANDYMQTVTGFAAALKASGISELEAAEAADKAVIAMADNANKMGTDMSSIQTAYQGFAKQNYTMLDNLKLGYGGTKEEMKRLLEDASALSGVEYDMSNLADVYTAIGVIQDNLGITGTTAKEAASTFSGSFAAMQAAAGNLMADLALGNEIDLTPLLTSVQTFIVGNFLPMLANIAQAVPQALSSAVPLVIEGMGQMGAAIGEQLPGIIQKGLEMAKGLAEGLRTNAGMLVDSAIELALNLAQGLADSIPTIVENVPTIVSSIANTINDNAPKILLAAGQIIITLVRGLIDSIPTIVENMPKIVMAIVDVISAFNWMSLGGKIIDLFGHGIGSMAGFIKSTAQSLADDLIGTLKTLPDTLRSLGGELVRGLFNGMTDMLGWLREKILGFGANVISAAKEAFGIHSPSKVFRDEVGMMLGLGAAEGISASTKAAQAAAGELADKVRTAAGAQISIGYQPGADELMQSGAPLRAAISSGWAEPAGRTNGADIAAAASAIIAAIRSKDMTVTLDGRTIGKTVQPYVAAETARRGARFAPA